LNADPALNPSWRFHKRVREVAAFEDDGASASRPLLCLVGGGALVLVSALLIAFIAYETTYLHRAGESGTIFWLGLAFFPYALGVFVFSLGYELGEPGRALRLTLLILVFSVVVVVAAGVVLLLLSPAGGGEAVLTAHGAQRGRGGLTLASEFGPSSDKDELASQTFTVTCERCGEMFIPLPPDAICPACGWKAVELTAQSPKSN
jgi:hypothetical protein